MISVEKFMTLSYYRFSPDSIEEGRKYPVIVQLHGTGGRGNNIEILNNNAVFGRVKNQSLTLPEECFIYAPQCHCNTWFELFEQLLQFVEYIAKEPYTDKDRMYLTGASLGGYTAWTLAMARPELFAALVPVCGGGLYWNAPRLKDMPVWAFHGALDNTVYVTESINMVKAVNACGGNAKLTIYPEAAHDAWTPTYDNPALYEWMFAQKKKRD